MSKPGPVNPAHTRTHTHGHRHTHTHLHCKDIYFACLFTIICQSSPCAYRTLIYAYIDRQCRHVHAHIYLKDTALCIVPEQRDLVICGYVGVKPDGECFLLFLHQAGRSHNESEVAEVSLLAVLIVITCTASNVKIIQRQHHRHILLRAEVSKNSLQHIKSCLKVSGCHSSLSLSLTLTHSLILSLFLTHSLSLNLG